MAISGGIKFAGKNEALLADGASVVASTGDASADYALDRNPLTYWRSVGSDDTTTETFDVILPSSVSFDRIWLIDHNFKSLTLQYDSGTDFSNPVGLDGALGGGIISETTFSDSTAYYEFDAVTSDTINLTATVAQTTDAEKYLGQIVVGTELGTLQGFPMISDVTHNRESRNRKTLSGRMLVQKSVETHALKLDFKRYITTSDYSADLDLMYTLFDRNEDFMVWLCGGKRSTTADFQYINRGWRLEDLYTMQIIKPFKTRYDKNFYRGAIDLSVVLQEVI